MCPRDLRAWALVAALLALTLAPVAAAQSAEPAPRAPPSSAHVTLEIETTAIELLPGARALVAYTLRNDGDGTIVARVQMDGVSADEKRLVALVRLDAGDVFRGRLPIQASDAAFRVVRVEAAVEGGMTTLAFLHVRSPLAFRSLGEPALVLDRVPTPLTFSAMEVPSCPREAPTTDLLLQLGLRGRVVDGKLVIELDAAQLAALQPSR